MSEFDPDAFLTLHLADGTERRLDRYNSGLFTFIGQMATGEDRASRNHVYFHFKDGDEKFGTYIFANSPPYKQIAGCMLQNDFPAYLNMNEIPPADEDAYQQMIENELKAAGEEPKDFIPDEWA